VVSPRLAPEPAPEPEPDNKEIVLSGRKKKPKKPTQADVWGALAERFGAERIMDRKGKRLKGIRFTVAGWTVVLDTTVESTGESSQSYTRLRGLYTEMRPFRFRTYTKSIFSDLGKALGMQDIVVGHPKVDDRWIIKSDSEGLVQSLLILPDVAEGLSRAKSGRFESRRFKRSMPDTRELKYQIMGVVTEEGTLEASVAMMFAALAQLVKMGVARAEPPAVSP
jgi:hypothetical protein